MAQWVKVFCKFDDLTLDLWNLLKSQNSSVHLFSTALLNIEIWRKKITLEAHGPAGLEYAAQWQTKDLASNKVEGQD